MQTRVKMPRVGENVNSVFIVDFLVQPGATISAGDMVITVETDKATVEVPSPVAGTVTEFLVKSDQEIAPGDVFMIVETA